MIINNDFKEECEKCPYIEPIASASTMYCDDGVFESIINVSCSKMDLCTQLQNYLGNACSCSDGSEGALKLDKDQCQGYAGQEYINFGDPGVIFTKK